MRIAALLMLSVLSACASKVDLQNLPSASYSCDDGTYLWVVFEPAAARVTLPNKQVAMLAQQRAASGMWYQSSEYELRGKGDDATWTARGRAPLACRAR